MTIQKEKFYVEVSKCTHPSIRPQCSAFTNTSHTVLNLDLETSNWRSGMTDLDVGRRVLDIALFSIRLWRKGSFGLVRCARGGSTIHEGMVYYGRPYTTWNGQTFSEAPLDLQSFSTAQDEIQVIADRVNLLASMENPILRRFGYFYFYPVGLDRLLLLTMACDRLLFPDYLGECPSGRENFKQRMCSLRKMIGGLPKPPPGFDDGDIYFARNGITHGTQFAAQGQHNPLPLKKLVIIWIRFFDQELENSWDWIFYL